MDRRTFTVAYGRNSNRDKWVPITGSVDGNQIVFASPQGYRFVRLSKEAVSAVAASGHSTYAFVSDGGSPWISGDLEGDGRKLH